MQVPAHASCVLPLINLMPGARCPERETPDPESSWARRPPAPPRSPWATQPLRECRGSRISCPAGLSRTARGTEASSAPARPGCSRSSRCLPGWRRWCPGGSQDCGTTVSPPADRRFVKTQLAPLPG